MKLILYINIILAALQLNAQSIEELEKKLSEKMSDSSRLELLVSLSSQSLYKDNTRARKYTTEGIELAKKIDENWSIAIGYKLASNLAIAEGNFSNALKNDQLLLQINTLLGDSIAISVALNRIGYNYSELGYFDEAYNYFTRAFKIARDVVTSKDDSLKLVIPLHNLGRLFKDLGQFDRAIDHLYVAQKISDKIGDAEGIAYTLDEVGDVYMRQEKYDESLQTFHEAIDHTNRLGIDFLRPRLYGRLAELNYKMGMYDQALLYYDSAEHLQVLSNNTYGLAEIEFGRGEVNIKRNNEIEAEALLLSSLAKSQELNARVLEMKVLVKLSELKESQEKYNEALEYFKQHELLEDELYSLEMQNRLSQGQIRFETESRDFIIDALSKKEEEREAELKRQEFIRNILVVIVALFGVLMFTLHRNGVRRRKMNLKLISQQTELEKRSHELQELNKVKDKFFSIISHDLRSPMNALSGLLDLLSKGQISDHDFQKLLKEIRAQFNHTKTLINNLLDWALLQMDKLSIHQEKINIKALVNDNFKLLDSLQTKSITLNNNVSDDVTAFADPNTVNLVFRNLIMNALKFTEDGGSITVDAEKGNGEITFSIKDTGIGIKPEILERLFDKTAPYSTRGTANEKGTGLGLILCKEFVEKNEGKIWVESEEGKGSIFKFTLKSA